jgi:hypothetical protein
LRRIVGLDFSTLDTERARIYQEREQSGRVLNQAKAGLAAMPTPTVETPDEEVSVASLMAEKEAEDRTNQEHARTRQRLNDATKEWAARERVVANLRIQLSEAETALDNAEETRAGFAMRVAELSDDVDTAPIVEQIKGAESVNRAVRAKAARAKIADSVTWLEGERLALTKSIDAIDAEKASKLASAKWPIDGLGFSPNGVTYRGLPFEQASESERVRVSVSIGCEQNPELKVMLIKEGCQLDDDSMAEVCRMAGEKDAMVWIERVTDDEPGAVILEDGEVARVNPRETTG